MHQDYIADTQEAMTLLLTTKEIDQYGRKRIEVIMILDRQLKALVMDHIARVVKDHIHIKEDGNLFIENFLKMYLQNIKIIGEQK